MDCLGCAFEDTSTLSTMCQSSLSLNTLMFLSLIESLFRSQCSIADPCRRAQTVKSPDAKDFEDKYHDFIIVGGGVAGSVLAGRLSENPNHKVLLLEAGPEEPISPSVPFFAFTAWNTSLDWNYHTVPQKNACLSTGGICIWPRGKMLCGTACMSGMMYTRGSPDIYDHWERLGNIGWNYQALLHYYKKSENNTQSPDMIERQYHGFDGPMKVGNFPHQPKKAKLILSAVEELGYRIGDLCGKYQTGFTTASVMVENGVRASPSRMYLRPAIHRPNLRVFIDSYAVKIQFNKEGNRATGVHFRDKFGNIRKVYASKEVILSGGVVGSPQLLLLSGVGPREDLTKLNIPVIKDLPVGQNLHHHFGIAATATMKNVAEDDFNIKSLYDYINWRNGPFSSTGLTQVTGFLETSKTTRNIPDIQVYLDGHGTTCEKYGSVQENITHITLRPVYLLSKCRGSIKLRSADPLDYPDIDPNYVCDQEEEDALIESIRMLQKLMKAKALKNNFIKFSAYVESGCESLPKDSDEYWRCQIRMYTLGENHHAGTCKMGPANDPTSVLDHQLRVHGIPNLRVIDASIMPTPINCNTIAPVLIIGEKGAQMIKDAWK
ncbi:glucose dehydrogenase [FAD, quinone]-like [Planococcus citri]|uniref:glucose dehydrogenase [FAD, quinone]-like n=1 Tax=Planococcus citri TaxID=170843 RepID=UPI0031F73D70